MRIANFNRKKTEKMWIMPLLDAIGGLEKQKRTE